MSEFSKLLKNSRFASLARPLARKRGKSYPTHQIVETRDAARSRQEWGLKYALPKIKSRYITFNDVDSLERLVDFEGGAGDHYRRLRFQELGVVPTRANAEHNPLFEEGKTAQSKSVENLMNLGSNDKRQKVDSALAQMRQLRPKLQEHLLKTRPIELSGGKPRTAKHFETAALEFLQQHKHDTSANTIASLQRADVRIAGTAGLSYKLKGRLRSSPNGVVHGEAAPARMVGSGNFALGGFVAQMAAGGKSQVARSDSFGVRAVSAALGANGGVSLRAQEVRVHNSGSSVIGGRVLQRKRARSDDVSLELVRKMAGKV